VVLILISIGLALGDVLIFDNTPPTWVLLAGAAVGLTAAYFALRIGLGMFANPAKKRQDTEQALWLGVAVVWLAMVGANLLLSGGQNDVTALAFIAMVGLLWTAVVVGAALYMRSLRVRAYFAEVAG
jgi:low temperature requirement protein LtrA